MTFILVPDYLVELTGKNKLNIKLSLNNILILIKVNTDGKSLVIHTHVKTIMKIENLSFSKFEIRLY